MKVFKNYLKESAYDQLHGTRTQEELNADRHVLSLMDLDEDHRRKHPESHPLEYDHQTLLAIRNFYLGKLHGDKYPEHAAELEKNKKQVELQHVHLVGDLIPSQPENI